MNQALLDEMSKFRWQHSLQESAASVLNKFLPLFKGYSLYAATEYYYRLRIVYFDRYVKQHTNATKTLVRLREKPKVKKFLELEEVRRSSGQCVLRLISLRIRLGCCWRDSGEFVNPSSSARSALFNVDARTTEEYDTHVRRIGSARTKSTSFATPKSRIRRMCFRDCRGCYFY